MSGSRIGELLVKSSLITKDDLDAVLADPDNDERFIGTILIEKDLVSEQSLIDTISTQYGIPAVDLEDYELTPDLIDKIPEELALKNGFLPVIADGNILTVALYDPSNITALNEVKFITGMEIKVVLASERQIREQWHSATDEPEETIDSIIDSINSEDVEIIETEDELDLAELERASEDAPVVKLVNAILMDAIKRRCSDIHIEPYEKSFRVRFRIDGVLQEIMRPPPRLKSAITSRIKVMSNLDISERRLPQDGRIKLKMGSRREMDFRVNVLPTLFGEKVVLRLLDKSNLQLDMTKLGFFENQLVDFKSAISKPHGMVLVTGPTGSGKTTTLYSALAELNRVDTNISTAEDPVEFNLGGINQAQMHEDIGFNFAAALRAFLRQDPDIIMVGEIRDYETAEIAIKASLTGHLVLSTLHTNSAPATVSRLLNMGVEPFLVASSISLIVAQRLGRKICEKCSEVVSEKDIDQLQALGLSMEEAINVEVRQGAGCVSCNDTGYKGRVAFYEVMKITDEIKEFVLNGASTAELTNEAVRLGMVNLRGSALQHLKDGTTTIEEVIRVTAGD